MMRHVYVGYDSREVEAYKVCVRSMRENARGCEPLVMPISSRTLGSAYRRPESLRNGVKWDDLSGQPMSTEFSLARFFVPVLMSSGWALFCDCDFLWRGNVEELFALADDRYAVMVVKHQQNPVETVKMDGQVQTAYARKNWSSLMLLNCSSPELRALTLDDLNRHTKHYLHGFRWIQDDARIGELSPTWNWLAGVNKPVDERDGPRVVHYTLGTPDMKGYEDSPYADEWRAHARG